MFGYKVKHSTEPLLLAVPAEPSKLVRAYKIVPEYRTGHPKYSYTTSLDTAFSYIEQSSDYYVALCMVYELPDGSLVTNCPVIPLATAKKYVPRV
jgi:hypothetical protein